MPLKPGPLFITITFLIHSYKLNGWGVDYAVITDGLRTYSSRLVLLNTRWNNVDVLQLLAFARYKWCNDLRFLPVIAQFTTYNEANDVSIYAITTLYLMDWRNEFTLLKLPFSVMVRLSSGHYGRVEVLYSGRWGTVCDDGFTNTSARFVCIPGPGAGGGGGYREGGFYLLSSPGLTCVRPSVRPSVRTRIMWKRKIYHTTKCPPYLETVLENSKFSLT